MDVQLRQTQNEEMAEVKNRISTLETELEDLKAKYWTIDDKIDSLTKKQEESHSSLFETNNQQNDLLNKIYYQSQAQTEQAQKNEARSIDIQKWLLGALWGLVSLVVIFVITSSLNALFM